MTTLKMIHKNYFQRFPVPPKVKHKIKLDTNKPPDQNRKQGKIILANICLSLRLIFLILLMDMLLREFRSSNNQRNKAPPKLPPKPTKTPHHSFCLKLTRILQQNENLALARDFKPTECWLVLLCLGFYPDFEYKLSSC